MNLDFILQERRAVMSRLYILVHPQPEAVIPQKVAPYRVVYSAIHRGGKLASRGGRTSNLQGVDPEERDGLYRAWTDGTSS